MDKLFKGSSVGIVLKQDVPRRSVLKGLAALALAGVGNGPSPLFAALPRKDMALVALLSDCHVGDWNSPRYQATKFAACVARVLALDPLPGRMIIPGDMAYLWGRKEDYRLFKRLLQPVVDAGIEVTLGMGNHDRRENFLEFWPEYADKTPVSGRIVSKVTGAHFDYILLDTLDQPKETDKWITAGVIDDEQREWLRGECGMARRPFLVLAHHPACELGENGNYRSARKFGEQILGKWESPTKCCGFIHGHDHRWYVTRSLLHWSDVRARQTAALPSTGHWGDIGYSLLREYPDRAELSLVQYDYFAPKPLPAGVPAKPEWQAIVRDNSQARCTFVALS